MEYNLVFYYPNRMVFGVLCYIKPKCKYVCSRIEIKTFDNKNFMDVCWGFGIRIFEAKILDKI